MEFLILFVAMVIGHMLADFPLQGDYLARAKLRTAGFPGVPWYYALFAHSAIHAGVVGLITGSVLCMVLELVLHMTIDFAKGEEEIDFATDQALHIVCKVAWALLVIGGAG